MTSSSATEQAPRALREQRKSDVSRILGRWLLSTCATAVAAANGVSRQLLGQWADPERDAAISVADAAGLPADGRMALAEYVAGEGFMVAPLPAAESCRAGIELHVRVLTETTQAVTAHAVAIADGRVDRREGAELECEIDEAIRALLTLRECARQAQREGVVGVALHAIAGGK